MAEDGSNTYYNRVYDYQPRTKAKGEHVRGDFTAVEEGFRKLPPHNEEGTGFTNTFVVENPTQPQSPVPYHHWRIWPEDVNANGFKLIGLPTPTVYDLDHAANVEYVHNALAAANDPNVHPGDAIAWAYIAQGGETVLEPPFQFYTCAVYIQGVYQNPYTAYTLGNFGGIIQPDTNNLTAKSSIHLTEPLEEGEEVVVLLGLHAPANAESLVYKQPMSICVNYATPVDGEYVYANMKMPVESHLPAGLPKSSALAITGPNAIYVINFYKNDALIGFVSWQPNQTEGVFSFQNDVTFNPGDVLKIQSQIAPEDQISGIGLVLHGWRKVANDMPEPSTN